MRIEHHINVILKITNGKLHALMRVPKYIKLAIEMYQVKNGLRPEIMANLFRWMDRWNGDFVIP